MITKIDSLPGSKLVLVQICLGVDTRATAFRKKFGKNAKTVELEALPVAELKRRIVKAIRKLIDFERWDRQAATEQVEFDSIQRFVDTLKNLPQAGS